MRRSRSALVCAEPIPLSVPHPILRRRLRPPGLLFALLLSVAVPVVRGGCMAAQEPSGSRSQAARSQAAPSQEAPIGLRLVDRIVAVVDEDPIFQSEIDRVIGLGLVERRQDETEAAFRRRVLSELVDQRLRYREVERNGSRTVTVDQIERQVAKLRADFPTEEAFEEHLRKSHVTRAELGQIVARQLAVVDYVDRRLGPRVFISLDDIQSYYDGELVPEMRERGARVPPLEEVRETIREVLRQRRLNDEIDRWTEELRRKADVQILIDDYPDEPPPVVQRIEAPPAG